MTSSFAHRARSAAGHSPPEGEVDLQARYQALFTHYPDGLCEINLDGIIVRCSNALALITGLPQDKLVGASHAQICVPTDQHRAQQAFEGACSGVHQPIQVTGLDVAERALTLHITYAPIMAEGVVTGIYGLCRDVTQQKRDEDELRLLKRGIEASPNGMVMADASQPDLPLVYVNEAFTQITGYSAEDVLGRNCRFLQGKLSSPRAIAAIQHGIANHEDVQVLLRNYRRDGKVFWNQLSISPVFNEAGECTHFIGCQQDVTRQREQEVRLAHQQAHDTLTGLPNLTALQARLAQALKECTQQHQHLALLYIDLDDFKPVNDAFDHWTGDQLLKAIAQRLRENVPPGGVVARMSSDEFVVMLPAYPSEQAVINLTNQLLTAIAQPFTLNDLCLHISASIGIATNNSRTSRPQSLLHQANLAMQEAKRQGRNTWQWYCGDAVANVAEHVIIRRELQEAIQANQFVAYYQPIVDAVDSTVRCVETLIRWQHPSKGLVFPGFFMPIAEQTGQIIAIGQWVLERACYDIAKLNRHRSQPLKVAVNISPMQFQRSGFLDEVKAALKGSGLPPAQLELEVTEGTLMTHTDQAISLLKEICELGISVALDDFGTGFSSLSYLRDLPISKVKLDRQFIREIAQNEKNAAIVQGVITIAHHLNLTVVAEGIETHEEQQDLQQRRCDLLQGFLFSRAVPIEALAALPEQLLDC
ncbi:putative bifunctional diguanylate cyclase/phosphodiesterase [Halomonas sp. G11]|uniref:putative bifunctional diguanylate cyclase/phosphodiesterase n=1 Tax=Halomonas sp. G11 TaxID=1684425 RepID=UPI00080085C7|nr:bifunctional diguanylate cyclase/phosphodiesterase [Halomonas sp. G11]OAZ89390.1 diguanylate cyclase [Halomonas sp. G11]